MAMSNLNATQKIKKDSMNTLSNRMENARQI